MGVSMLLFFFFLQLELLFSLSFFSQSWVSICKLGQGFEFTLTFSALDLIGIMHTLGNDPITLAKRKLCLR